MVCYHKEEKLGATKKRFESKHLVMTFFNGHRFIYVLPRPFEGNLGQHQLNLEGPRHLHEAFEEEEAGDVVPGVVFPLG